MGDFPYDFVGFGIKKQEISASVGGVGTGEEAKSLFLRNFAENSDKNLVISSRKCYNINILFIWKKGVCFGVFGGRASGGAYRA